MTVQYIVKSDLRSEQIVNPYKLEKTTSFSEIARAVFGVTTKACKSLHSACALFDTNIYAAGHLGGVPAGQLTAQRVKAFPSTVGTAYKNEPGC